MHQASYHVLCAYGAMCLHWDTSEHQTRLNVHGLHRYWGTKTRTLRNTVLHWFLIHELFKYQGLNKKHVLESMCVDFGRWKCILFIYFIINMVNNCKANGIIIMECNFVKMCHVRSIRQIKIFDFKYNLLYKYNFF